MGTPIPEPWRVQVCAILNSGDLKKSIIITERAQRNWSDLFPELFICDLLNALSEALDDPELMGRQIFEMNELGEVYEFIFIHSNRPVYAKINLCPDGKIIIIYSAHRPFKGQTL